MIRINLLPEKEVKRRRVVEGAAPARQVSPLATLVILALFALIGGFYYFGVRARLYPRRTSEQKLRTELERVTDDIEKRYKSVTDLQKLDSISKSMLDIVYALDPEDRLLWSEKLNQLSDLVPENVYISHISVSETIAKKETAGSQRQRGQWLAEQKAKGKVKRPAGKAIGEPVVIYYPEITQTLQVQAIAHSENDAERIRLINEFHDNLTKGVNEQAKTKTNFMKGFTGQIEIGDIAPKVVGGRGVAEFSFSMKTKPTAAKDSGTTEGLLGVITKTRPRTSEKEEPTEKGGTKPERRPAREEKEVFE